MNKSIVSSISFAKAAFVCMAVSFLSAVSCNINDASEPALIQMSFSASQSESDVTKTLRQDDEAGSVFWSAKDTVKIFRGQYCGVFVTENDSPVSRAIFSGSISSAAQGDFWAVYPNSEDASFDGETVTVTVNPVQPSVNAPGVGTFAERQFPLIAKSSGEHLAFKSICGGVKFSVSQAGVRSVIFEGNNDEILSGTVKVALDANGIPEVHEIVSGSKTVQVLAPDGGTFDTDKYYYITILPKSLTNGFNLTYCKDDGEYGTFTVGTNINVARSVFGRVYTKDAKVEFTTPFTRSNDGGAYSAADSADPVHVISYVRYADQEMYGTGTGYKIYRIMNLESGKDFSITLQTDTPLAGQSYQCLLSRDGLSEYSVDMKVLRVKQSRIWLLNEADHSGYIMSLE